MPSQLNDSRGLKSRSGIGGGGAVIRQSAINHAARVASQAATHRTYLNQYQQPDKASHRTRQQQQPMTYSSTQPLSPIRHTHTDMYPTYTEQEFAEIQNDETHASDCLCTICSCGKHKCPPTPHTAHYDPYLSSEHHAQYTPKKTTTQRVEKSMSIPKSVPFQGNSIYQDSFKPHPLSHSRLVRTSAELHDTGVGRNNAPFLGETTNQSAYKRWNAPPAESVQQKHKWSQLKEDREFQSEYRSQHDKKAIPATTRGKEPWYIPPSMAFQGDSTSHSDYHAHPDGYPSRSYRPHDYRTWLPDNRDFQSEHTSHYTPKANPLCPAGPLSKGVTKSIGHHGHIHVEKQFNGTWKRSQPL